MRRLLGAAGPDPQLGLDADLRPEGKNGPLVRTLQSYRAYYARWSLVWEAQALLRATPVAGDAELGREFLALIDPLRWPAGGLAASTTCARSARSRPGWSPSGCPAAPTRKAHLKLGLGGLSDVEWTVQLLQLRHGCEVPALRTTSTLEGLAAARAAGLLSDADADALGAAWQLASRLRNAGVLWRGRPVQALPSDLRDADGIGRIVGREPGTGAALAEDYRRLARRARAAVVSNFYESA